MNENQLGGNSYSSRRFDIAVKPDQAQGRFVTCRMNISFLQRGASHRPTCKTPVINGLKREVYRARTLN